MIKQGLALLVLVLTLSSRIFGQDATIEQKKVEECDTLYCSEQTFANQGNVSKAAKLFENRDVTHSFYLSPGDDKTASGLPCDGRDCALTTRNGSGAYKFREHDTVLSTLLGGTVGTLTGHRAFGDPGAIGFGITGALWGNKQSGDYKPAKFKRWESQIKAREEVLNNFRDMVFDPTAPIPIDAHYLGGRPKKKD